MYVPPSPATFSPDTQRVCSRGLRYWVLLKMMHHVGVVSERSIIICHFWQNVYYLLYYHYVRALCTYVRGVCVFVDRSLHISVSSLPESLLFYTVRYPR